MAESDEYSRVQDDPVFLALTRPAMIIGVTYTWFTLEGLIWLVAFINTKDFALVIPGSIATHAIGIYLGRKEPRIIELFLTKGKNCMKCRNTSYFGNTQSYDLNK